MFRTLLSLQAAALFTLLVVPASSYAQQGPGQQGPYWDRAQRSERYSAPASAPAPVSSQSFFNAPQQADRSVLLELHVPAGASIWFDGAATTQTGAVRQFLSPALTPGQSYVYKVRVQWKDGEQMIDQTRPVTVRAGDRINLDFGTAR
jgi:uncharacterized protein (TIGR03000 family)